MFAKLIDLLIDTLPYFMPGFNHRFDCHHSRVGDKVKLIWTRESYGPITINGATSSKMQKMATGGQVPGLTRPYKVEVLLPGEYWVECDGYDADSYSDSLLRAMNNGPVVKFGGDA